MSRCAAGRAAPAGSGRSRRPAVARSGLGRTRARHNPGRYSAERLRNRSNSATGRRVPTASRSSMTSWVRRSSRSASTEARSATIAVARRSCRASRLCRSSARHVIIRTGALALAVAARHADGANRASSPSTEPGPRVAMTRPRLSTSTAPSRIAATPSAASPSSKIVEPDEATLTMISRSSWSRSSSTTSRNGHAARIVARRSASKRGLRDCRWVGQGDTKRLAHFEAPRVHRDCSSPPSGRRPVSSGQ